MFYRGAIVALALGILTACGSEKPDPLRDHRAELDAIEPTDRAVIELSRRGDMMDLAVGYYRAHCAVCHSVKGTGINAPNLTDDAYLNVRSPSGLYDIISYGRHAKGMPAWEEKLGKAERLLLAAYAASLRGTRDDGKPAEGDELPTWETYLSE